MESLITKLLGSYLKRFIKGFNKEMLKVQMLKGSATITNFELNGEVLQEITLIPPNLEIVSAKCTELQLQVPYTNLKHEPITITLDRLDLHLREPDVIKPMPDILSKLNQGKKEAGDLAIIKGIKIVVKEIHVHTETLGTNTWHPNWKPGLNVVVRNVVIQSTNDKWEVVDLAQTIITDKEKGIIRTYKQATVHSISIESQMVAGEDPVPIIDNMPVEIRFVNETEAKSGAWIGSSVHCIFEELSFSWTQGMWQRMVDLVISFKACLTREVPDKPDAHKRVEEAIQAHDIKTNKLWYGITLHRFVIELSQGQQGGENGFTFFGFGLELNLSPERLTTYTIKDLGGRGQDQVVGCWESVFKLGMTNVTFREKQPSSSKEPRYMRLLTQAVHTPPEKAFRPVHPGLLNLSVKYRTKIEGDESVQRRVPTLEFGGSLHGAQLVFDKQVWKDLYTFIIEGPIEAYLGDSGDILQMLLQLKPEEYLYLNSKFSMQATELMVVLPNLPDSSDPVLRDLALHMMIGKLGITNQPDWPFPPFLKDALIALPDSPQELTPEEGTVHKFQAELQRVTCELVVAANETVEEAILEPASFRLYGRYFPPKTMQDKLHRIETTLHSSDIKGRLSKQGLRYIRHIEREHTQWGERMGVEETERKNMNKMLKLASTGISQLTSSQVTQESAAQASSATTDDVDITKTVVDGIKYSLAKYVYSTFYARLEKAILSLLSPGSLSQLIEEEKLIDAQQSNNKDKEKQSPEEEESEKRVIPNPEEEKAESLSEVMFDRFEMALDNNCHSQSAVLKLRAVRASGLDHPDLPLATELRPILDNSGDNQNLLCQFQRKRDEKAGGHITHFNTRVQGMQMLTVGKPAQFDRGLSLLVPKVQQLFAKLTSLWEKTSAEQRQQMVEQVKEGLFKAKQAAEEILEGGWEKQNVHWSVELGDCEVQYLNSLEELKDKSNEKQPRGRIRFSNLNKDAMNKRFSDVEEQLISSKLSLAQAESEKFDLNSQIAQGRDQVERLRKELQRLEQQLVETKFTLAEAQADNDRMKTELTKAGGGQGGGSGSSGNIGGGRPQKSGGFFSRKKGN
ncbi:Chorein N-terminal domain-containing protein [Balamuthia mandrillaris]